MKNAGFDDKQVSNETTSLELKSNPLRTVEESIEQNDNNIDGIINNLPPVKEEDVSNLQSEQLSMHEKEKSIRKKLKESSKLRTKQKAAECIEGRKENGTIDL